MADVLQGIEAVVSTQLLARAVTFVLNVLVARLAAPSDYGVGYVSLQLLSNLSLFMTKEGFRKVALRTVDGADVGEALKSSLNLAVGGTLVASVLSPMLSAYWAHTAPNQAPWSYFLGLGLMALASILEAAGEPLVVRTLAAHDFQGRAMGEGVAILARSVCMLLLAILLGDLPFAFAGSQLLYSAVWVGWFVRRGGAMPWPTRLPGGAWMLSQHRALLGEFTGMVLLKLALTEGEKLVLLAFFAEKDWGVFALVSNLGSIVLRLLFAPTEEIAYSAFAAAESESGQHWKLLRALLLLQGGVGWLGLCFGPGFSRLVVRVLYGPIWAQSEAPSVLAAYCVLLFSMALNGVLEAFMYAQCPKEWVRVCKSCQLVISAVLVGAAWAGRGLGPVALVWANCASMILRVLLCAVFTKRHLKLQWGDLHAYSVAKLFSVLAIGGLCSSAMVPSTTQGVPWAHAAAAVGLAVVWIAGTLYLCKDELRSTVAAVRHGKDA